MGAGPDRRGAPWTPLWFERVPGAASAWPHRLLTLTLYLSCAVGSVPQVLYSVCSVASRFLVLRQVHSVVHRYATFACTDSHDAGWYTLRGMQVCHTLQYVHFALHLNNNAHCDTATFIAANTSPPAPASSRDCHPLLVAHDIGEHRDLPAAAVVDSMQLHVKHLPRACSPFHADLQQHRPHQGSHLCCIIAKMVLVFTCGQEPTSDCLALKNVDGPTGGPSSGGTTMRRLPPGRMPLTPSSNPGQPGASQALLACNIWEVTTRHWQSRAHISLPLGSRLYTERVWCDINRQMDGFWVRGACAAGCLIPTAADLQPSSSQAVEIDTTAHHAATYRLSRLHGARVVARRAHQV